MSYLTIVELEQADAAITGQIRLLEAECRRHDGIVGKVYLDSGFNFDRSIKSLFLGYEGSKLVSFLSLFMPTPDEAEVSGMTLPAYRRRGYFSRLLERAEAELTDRNIGEMLFVCESSSQDGLSALRALGSQYDFTEYLMKYSRAKDTDRARINPASELVPAMKSDLGLLTEMDTVIFESNAADSEKMVRNTLESSNRRQYILLNEGQKAGLAAISEENGEATIYGLGILPEFRGRGLGKELLWHLTRLLLKEGFNTILLEVDSSNSVARRLYFSCGFEEECAISYFRIKTPRLTGSGRGPREEEKMLK